MPQYIIRPTKPVLPEIHIDALDAAAVLIAMERFKCEVADVDTDGGYSFSVRVDHEGLWSIFPKVIPPKP